MNFYIKNMVCPRCIMAVEGILTDMEIKPVFVKLGEVAVDGTLNQEIIMYFSDRLQKLGFELLDDLHPQQIEKIKTIIINHIHFLDDAKFAFTDVIAKELEKDYSQLSKLFSATEGITIEQYIINQKIEKVKELLAYNKMNLSEISYKLGYSSVAHLSTQFKKVTGLTPSGFKASGIDLRKSIDSI